jgi:hypothetical protein
MAAQMTGKKQYPRKKADQAELEQALRDIGDVPFTDSFGIYHD